MKSKNNRYLYASRKKNRIYKIKKFENDKDMEGIESRTQYQIYLGLRYDEQNEVLPKDKRLLYNQLKIKFGIKQTKG